MLLNQIEGRETVTSAYLHPQTLHLSVCVTQYAKILSIRDVMLDTGLHWK